MINMSVEKRKRSFQLNFMAVLAFLMPLLVMVIARFRYGLPYPASISETATIIEGTVSILPYGMGALALFSLNYAINFAHDYWLDRVLPALMFLGFTLVAAQPCASPYLISDRVGWFSLTQEASNLVHCVGAVGGFGSAILWVLCCWTRSDLPKAKQTFMKRVRNSVYGTLGCLMIASLFIFVLDWIGVFYDGFEAVMNTEWALCALFALALATKGEMFKFLRDKKAQRN
jgi:hypothetical protein